LKTHRDGGRKRKPCRQRPKQRQYKGTQVDRVYRTSGKTREDARRTATGHARGDTAEIQDASGVPRAHVPRRRRFGGSDVDVTRRTTIARRRFHELTWLWRDDQIGEALKISIYQSDVLSVVLWGAEGWLLTDDIQKQLNGWNNRCLSRITGRSPREEASPRTQCMCVPGSVRYRRMVWLGHILRSPGGCMERRAVLRNNELRMREM
jgi:hypothetical protein